ncbi:MAG: hypothetical protein EBU90_26255 [Proteobacteria bacterium]|nr:hypothetical protein [Pseudomonadota bacterium]
MTFFQNHIKCTINEVLQSNFFGEGIKDNLKQYPSNHFVMFTYNHYKVISPLEMESVEQEVKNKIKTIKK